MFHSKKPFMAQTPSESPLVTAAAAPAGLDRSLVHGIAWTGGVKWFTQLLTWASTLIVARLLSPTDYGIVSMATAYLGLVTIASEFGIGTAVITLRELTADQLAQLNSLAVALGVAGFGLSVLLAVPLSRFFHSPQLPMVVVILSLTFVITGFKSVPTSMLQRDLRFKTLSVIDGVRALVLAVATVLFALAGLRYWTLVLGGLLSASVGTIFTLVVQRARFQRPHWQSLRKAMTMSWHLLVNRVSWYAYSNADFVVAGRVLGQAELGAYTVGWNLANTPIQQITSLVGTVTSALFSAVQTEYTMLRRYFLNLTEALALVTFPLTIGLALVSHEFVFAVLGGAKWSGVVSPLRLLALYASIRSVTPLLSHVLTVTGETRFGMELSVISLFAYPLGFYIGSHWGTTGIAAAWMIIDPILNMPVYRKVFQKLHLTTGKYLEALRPPITGSLLMSVALMSLRPFLPDGWPQAVKLAVLVLTGAVVYVGALLIFHGGRLRALYQRLDAVRKRKAQPEPPELDPTAL
jgi:O-antigen/teichoic acid export membrane protein